VVITRLDLRTVSLSNTREHWAKRAKRAKHHRQCAWYVTPSYPLPCIVRLIRIAPRALDDDNLTGALKSVRDGVADGLGVDDRDPRVSWEYAQERGKAGEYAVRIEIRS